VNFPSVPYGDFRLIKIQLLAISSLIKFLGTSVWKNFQFGNFHLKKLSLLGTFFLMNFFFGNFLFGTYIEKLLN